jgi:hypothetical protein
VCKAENAERPACRRCKADLSLLWALEERRAWALAAARRALAAGRLTEGMIFVGEVEGIRSDEQSSRLAASTQLLSGDFVGAWRRFPKVSRTALDEAS